MESLINDMETLIRSFEYKYVKECDEPMNCSFIIYHPDNRMEISYNISKTKGNEGSYVLYISMWDDCVDTSMFVDKICDCYFEDIELNENNTQHAFEDEIKPSITACLTAFKNGFTYDDEDE
jgi:hypothetical protein